MVASLPQPSSPLVDNTIPSPVRSVDIAHDQHPDMNSQTPDTPPSNVVDPFPKKSVTSTIRRTRSPPRNAANEIICDHPDCANKQPREVFKRRCEYNKHMDRHERPYKCDEAGCELSLGFTYSGGLLRHQREVHKMHLSSKQLLFCPFKNCNRSHGAGFTRKENLEEHKRRRHLGQLDQNSISIPGEGAPLLLTPPTVERKRKRLPTPQSAEDEEGSNGDFLTRHVMTGGLDIHSTLKALRARLAHMDQIIQWQETEMQRLRNIITSLPPQALYNINTATPVGLGGTDDVASPSDDGKYASKQTG